MCVTGRLRRPAQQPDQGLKTGLVNEGFWNSKIMNLEHYRAISRNLLDAAVQSCRRRKISVKSQGPRSIVKSLPGPCQGWTHERQLGVWISIDCFFHILVLSPEMRTVRPRVGPVSPRECQPSADMQNLVRRIRRVCQIVRVAHRTANPVQATRAVNQRTAKQRVTRWKESCNVRCRRPGIY